MDSKDLECPITLELLDDPIATPCCGRSFSRKPLQESLECNGSCPVCRKDLKRDFPSFDVKTTPKLKALASLVEQHRAESGDEDFTPINILVIGRMGAGKSTLGNYLYNFNPPEKNLPKMKQFNLPTKRLFKSVRESENFHQGRTAGTTTCCLKQTFKRGKFEFNLIDTPGLGEVNPMKDFTHMIDLLKTIQDLGEIHWVIYVKEWMTANSKESVDQGKFYREFLYPLFDERRLVVVISKVSDSDFENTFIDDDSQLDRIAMEKQRSADLQSLMKIWKAPIDFLFYFDLAPGWRGLFRDVLKNRPEPFRDFCKMIIHEECSLVKYSADQREQLLEILQNARGINVKDTLFRFPPSINEIRKAHVDVLRSQQRGVEKALQLEEIAEGSILEGKRTLQETIQELQNGIQDMENQIKNLSGPKASEPYVQCSARRSWKFMTLDSKFPFHQEIHLPAPPVGQPMICQHYASWRELSREQEPDGPGFVITGEVSLPWFQLVWSSPEESARERDLGFSPVRRKVDEEIDTNDQYRWFMFVTYYYDGAISNREQIQILRRAIVQSQEEKTKKEDQMRKLQAQEKELGSQKGRHDEELGRYLAKLAIFDNPFIELAKLHQFIQEYQELVEASMGHWGSGQILK